MSLEMIGVTIATTDGKITNTIKPDKPGKNYYAEQSVFSKYQQETQNTDYIDNVTLTVNINNKNPTLYLRSGFSLQIYIF